MADLLLDRFDSKPSRKAFDLPFTCHPSASLTTFAFMSSEMRRLLLDLDPYSGTDPLGMFALFLKSVRWLIPMYSFSACWIQANVTLILKGPPSSTVANYRPISITSTLSKVFERLVSIRLLRFMEGSGVLPTTQKGLGTCDALLCMSHTLQSALESGQEAWIVQIYFSAALDRVNHQGILYKLCSVGIGGSVVSILTQFLSNRSQHIMVDDCWSKRINVLSEVPQGSVLVLGPLLFLLYTSELFFNSGK